LAVHVDYIVLSRCARLTDRETDRQISTERPYVCIRSRTMKTKTRSNNNLRHVHHALVIQQNLTLDDSSLLYKDG